MGLFDKFKKPSKPEPIACTAAPLTVLAPVDGQPVKASQPVITVSK